jgi:D-serine deaminase-like pyridoxal phosphate-dependent protein
MLQGAQHNQGVVLVIDRDAVAALRTERIDWRFKGMPSEVFGSTVGEVADAKLNLFEAGFVGPLVVLDAPALEHNLGVMADWCADNGLALAPHGKTTMAPQLFARQLDRGAWGITAANISQLRVYRAFGVSRIVFANQLVDPAGLRWLAAELDRDPGFEFMCWVDSVAGVQRMTEVLNRPVDVLVELGGVGGRTGARGLEAAIEVAEAVRASPVLRLIGVSGYEAAVTSGTDEAGLSKVDEYLKVLRALVVRLATDGHFDDGAQVIVTGGGSSYFDQVAEAFTQGWPSGLNVLGVLRSGAYLTHDDGLYRETSPFGRKHRLPGGEPFQSAMHAWAQVTSYPEPGLALLTMGRRDVSFDQHLPEPQAHRRADGSVVPLRLSTTRSLADQHAFLGLGESEDVEVGDWIKFGLSHPCTVFDKWQLLPVVDGEQVVDLVRTFF